MQFSLLSPEFLTLSIVAIVVLGVLRGPGRQTTFLGLNLVFVAVLLLGPVLAASSIGFVLIGYALVRVVQRFPETTLAPAITAYTLLFMYMRDYDFLHWLLPEALLTSTLATVGLSFLFFKVLHVMIDARSGTLGRFDLPTYLNYSLNFTTFMMGPIQRYQDYREQWDGERAAIPLNFEAHLDALLRILIGFVKAYILAAWLLPRALQPTQNLLDLSLWSFMLKCYVFYFYLYMNFSGYCDVVIGIGSLMGVRPPENFNMPFMARNISDFWLRQHRSLTLWLTDYVFTPAFKRVLSGAWGARHSLAAACTCLMLTMLVSGLWHGTTVSFLLFGIVHGLWFVIYRVWDAILTRQIGRKRVRNWREHKLVHIGGIVLTFNATAFTFVFFQVRPDSLMQAYRGFVG
jgi:D-alanyl-lipoteichoic acid acyltransferase DltB (MBOAT superfamily)